MANPVPAGSGVSSGTYTCTNCGYELEGRLNEAPAALPVMRER
jgi:hypothetical protein